MNEAAALGLELAGVIALISFVCSVPELLKGAQGSRWPGLTRLLGRFRALAHRRGQVLRGNSQIAQPQPET